jgi:hypothetical protein
MLSLTDEEAGKSGGITLGSVNNEPVAWIDKESNTTMIGGIYPRKLEEYLNSLETRIKELEEILRKAQGD